MLCIFCNCGPSCENKGVVIALLEQFEDGEVEERDGSGEAVAEGNMIVDFAELPKEIVLHDNGSLVDEGEEANEEDEVFDGIDEIEQ